MYTPKGYLFSAVEAAIKKAGRKDLALIYSEREAIMAGMFTTNKIKAAPVRLDMKLIKRGKGQAIIVNSGNANACNGRQGMIDAIEMAELTAKALGIKPTSVYVCSTGVIGTPMPMEKIRPKIVELVNNLGKSDIMDVATSIMTTDAFPKAVSKKIKIDGKTIVISGICKGAGMISPNLATMLCFIITDINLERSLLNRALRSAVRNSFNKITVDGDMSTNDTVLIMANGMAGNRPITEKLGNSAGFRKFSETLNEVTYELSKMIVKDGEGATKFIEIEVKNAKNNRDAEKAAFAIANSLLVKTALYGNDANWGRIMAALGYSNISIKEDRVDIFLNDLAVVKGGVGTGVDKEANKKLKSKEAKIQVNLNLGKGYAKVLTSDLTEEYVRINAEYRT